MKDSSGSLQTQNSEVTIVSKKRNAFLREQTAAVGTCLATHSSGALYEISETTVAVIYPVASWN